MEPHTSHHGAISLGGVNSSGNPEEFYGVAVVGFVDLLGFSASVRRDWSTDEGSTLAKLLRIKNRGQGWQDTKIAVVDKNDEGMPPQAVYQCRVYTVSDSIVLACALGNPTELPDLNLSVSALFGGIGFIWEQAILEGFSIRGAVEVGQIYWTPSETIGPAFLDCYEYESKLADWSRVLIGPLLLEAISKLSPSADTFGFLARSQDGLIELAPIRLKNSAKIAQLQCIRAAAGRTNQKKYDPLLTHLTKGWRAVAPTDLIRARAEIKKRIERIERKRKTAR